MLNLIIVILFFSVLTCLLFIRTDIFG